MAVCKICSAQCEAAVVQRGIEHRPFCAWPDNLANLSVRVLVVLCNLNTCIRS